MTRPTTDQLQAILDCINEADRCFETPDPSVHTADRARMISNAREGLHRIMVERSAS